MNTNPADEPQSTAIEQLKAFGLSTYAAQTFVALVSLGEGTAKDVSSVSGVPRTRVYDAVDELQNRGLVNVQHAKPKRFTPISAETTSRQFKQIWAQRVDTLTEALDNLESVSRPYEQRGVWTVSGRETITERIVSFIESASEEVVMMTAAELLNEKCLEALQTASEHGADIRLGAPSTEVQKRVLETVPAAVTFESIWDWHDVPAGRLVMVDQEKTVASVLEPTTATNTSHAEQETAIWGVGDTNSLVVILKLMFTWQRNDTSDE